MDKAKIAKLCNEIEDEVTDIAFYTSSEHTYKSCVSIRIYLKAIGNELTGDAETD